MLLCHSFYKPIATDSGSSWEPDEYVEYGGSDDEAWRIISSTAKAQSEDKKSIDPLNQTIRKRKMGIKDLSDGEVASIGIKQIKCWTKGSKLMISRERFLNLHASDAGHLSRKPRKAMT